MSYARLAMAGPATTVVAPTRPAFPSPSTRRVRVLTIFLAPGRRPIRAGWSPGPQGVHAGCGRVPPSRTASLPAALHSPTFARAPHRPIPHPLQRRLSDEVDRSDPLGAQPPRLDQLPYPPPADPQSFGHLVDRQQFSHTHPARESLPGGDNNSTAAGRIFDNYILPSAGGFRRVRGAGNPPGRFLPASAKN